MKSNRILNGYTVIYEPNHPKAMKSANWEGYVYEHVIIAEEHSNRVISHLEDVHHLDFDRSNNHPSNLIILSKKDHKKLHKWVEDCGVMMTKIDGVKKGNCLKCGKEILGVKRKYCTTECLKLDKKSVLDDIPLNEVLFGIKTFGCVKTAKKYGVSDKRVMNWLAHKHNLFGENFKKAVANVTDINNNSL